MDGAVRLLPWVHVRGDRSLDFAVQTLPNALGVVDQQAPQPFNPDSLHEAVGPFQILAVLPVVLNKAAHELKYFVVRIDDAQHISLSNSRTGGAAHVYLPLASLDRHGAKVLCRGFGTVARAARGGELHLVWRFN